MKFAKHLGLIAAAACFAASSAIAQTDPTSLVSVTKHQVHLDDGRTLDYTAEVGLMPIRPIGSVEVHGYIGYTSYRAVPANGQTRPVAFLWGGGPSGPSSGDNTAFGPRHIVDNKIVDNELTLLNVADLVFVDPVGTGFARPTKPEYASEFYQVLGDQASVAEFIRVWRAEKDPANSPVFLYGVSYGTWRVSGVTELLEKSGVHVAGSILNSGGIQLGLDAQPKDINNALRTPGRAATALFYHMLPADLGTDRDKVIEAARKWSMDVYAPALARVDQLTPAQREDIAKQLSRWTGYPLDKIDRKTLDIKPREYLANLLPGKALNLNDMRVATEARGRGERAEGGEGGARPTMMPRVTFSDYIRGELGYHTDLAYLPNEHGYSSVGGTYVAPGSNWNYNHVKVTPEMMALAQAGEGPPGSDAWIKRAMAMDPDLKVMVTAGIYDSLNSCTGDEDTIARQPKDIAQRFTFRCYASGHGIRDPKAVPAFNADLRAFIAKTIKQ